MGAYLVRRFGLMLLTLFGISIIIFMLLRLTPGNIADILFDEFKDPRFAAPTLLRQMVAAGYLGRKTGRGFYDYEAGEQPPSR